MTDHEFAIDFVARMLRLVQGGDFRPPINESLRAAASDMVYADAVRMLEERLAEVRKETSMSVTLAKNYATFHSSKGQIKLDD